jgi:phospholipase/carboxylesterase
MTHRFPHDFWAKGLSVQSGFRFDASLPNGLGPAKSFGFSRGVDWQALAPDSDEELIGLFIDETVLDQAEFDEEPLDEGPDAGLVNDLHPASTSTGLFIPEKYEPNYPYPLLLWLHDQGRDESDLLTKMPLVSERNYFGVSLRGPVSLQAGFDWPTRPDAVTKLERDIYHTICQLRRNLHIHSERIFLAGEGSGATMAFRLLLNRAEWFAGAFGIGGELPEFDSTNPLHPELPERRAFLTTASLEDQPQIRLWLAAGMNLQVHVDPAPKTSARARLSELNHWLMESICTPV